MTTPDPTSLHSLPPIANPRQARLRRAEQILDRWLDLFEDALGNARPDPSKTTELANVFTIMKRILEIEHLAQKIAALEAARDGSNGFAIPADLLADGIPGSDEDG